MRIMISLLLSAVSIIAYCEMTESEEKKNSDIRSELNRLSHAEHEKNLKQIERINRLPPTAAGSTPTQSCQFARNVMKGKELQLVELRRSFYTAREYQEAFTEVEAWRAQVKEACE